ncbi:MAG TPA: hypothetical protein PKA37_16730, partial [Planctomycetota bacterium]|nr:hypothetical protein [Planctomycetota bacterium]
MSPLRVSRSEGFEARLLVSLVLICLVSQIHAQQPLRHWAGAPGWFAMDGEARFGHIGRSGSVLADAEGLLLIAPAMGTSRAVLRLRMEGGSRFNYTTVAAASGCINFLLGNDARSHRRRVRCWSRIRGVDQLTGIGWDLLHERGAVRYDVVLPPDAHPGQVRLTFDGADHMETTTDGGLLIHVGGYILRQGRPLFLVETEDGAVLEVSARCVLNEDQTFAFVPCGVLPLGRVRIDPRLEWASYLGGSITFDDVRTFSSGPGSTMIAAGTSQALGGFFGGINDFPLTPGAYQTSAEQRTTFLCCMSDDGNDSLMWATFLGGAGSDSLSALHADAVGNVT